MSSIESQIENRVHNVNVFLDQFNTFFNEKSKQASERASRFFRIVFISSIFIAFILWLCVIFFVTNDLLILCVALGIIFCLFWMINFSRRFIYHRYCLHFNPQSINYMLDNFFAENKHAAAFEHDLRFFVNLPFSVPEDAEIYVYVEASHD